MCEFNEVMPHGEIEEVFPDVFFVVGTMKGPFFGSTWTFSRNMTIVRDGDELSLINAVRLDDDGLAKLESLGTVKNVVKIGSMHGHDDAFYIDRYDATFWALPGMPHDGDLAPDRELVVDGEMPFGGCTMFSFEETKLPEAILLLDRAGGIAIACDSLQNWCKSDEFFDAGTVETMTGMGFFTPANLGPAWMHVNDPKPGDFVRLKEVAFKHALCGHGEPLRDTAGDDFAATFNRVFDV